MFAWQGKRPAEQRQKLRARLTPELEAQLLKLLRAGQRLARLERRRAGWRPANCCHLQAQCTFRYTTRPFRGDPHGSERPCNSNNTVR